MSIQRKSDIPTHHVKHELCTTRPAYRQGRDLKAVKVYTINEESKHLVISGLSAVGGGEELRKTCEKFGEIEDMKPLDEYPCDEFTEVYWVKYKRSQSARYAKKYLDDISMFGGVLHVFYAPEFESVQETREKLQERRKMIAARTRFSGKNVNVTTKDKKLERSSSNISSISHMISHHTTVSQFSDANDISNNERLSFISNHEEDQSGCCVSSFTTIANSAFSNSRNFNNFASQTEDQRTSISRVSTEAADNDHIAKSFYTLTLPPPPVNLPIYMHPTEIKTNFEFARVPSANAVFPSSYDARLTPDSIVIEVPPQKVIRPMNVGDAAKQWNTMYDYKPHEHKSAVSVSETKTESIILDKNETIAIVECLSEDSSEFQLSVPPVDMSVLNSKNFASREQSKTKQITFTKKQTASFGENHGYVIKENKKVIQNYKPTSKSKPKFIPRQVTTTNMSNYQTSIDSSNYIDKNLQSHGSKQENVNNKLKLNAFNLRELQGPNVPPDFEKSDVKTSIDDSLQKTVKLIREQLKTSQTANEADIPSCSKKLKPATT